jgi:hypothetical protein
MAGVSRSPRPHRVDPDRLLTIEQAFLRARSRLPAGMPLPLISWLRAEWRRRHGVPDIKMGARKPVLFDPDALDAWTKKYLRGETRKRP